MNWIAKQFFAEVMDQCSELSNNSTGWTIDGDRAIYTQLQAKFLLSVELEVETVESPPNTAHTQI